MKAMAGTSVGAIGTFEAGFTRFAESAEQVRSMVDLAQDMSFTSLVKLDHILYMQNAYMTVNNGTESDEAKAVSVDHHNCRLGKWYETGQGQKLFSHMPSFPKLVEPHSAVHGNVHNALELLAQPWQRDDAVRARLIGCFQQAEEASWAVVQNIESLLAEKHGR
jgi:hypothetical protein